MSKQTIPEARGAQTITTSSQGLRRVFEVSEGHAAILHVCQIQHELLTDEVSLSLCLSFGDIVIKLDLQQLLRKNRCSV